MDVGMLGPLEGDDRSPTKVSTRARIATMLFTDVEGSTRLLNELGRGPYYEALVDHHEIVRSECRREGGSEISVAGDGFVLIFPTASGGLNCALAIQRRLADTLPPERGPFRVRMALHAGEMASGVAGEVGMALHEAARVMGAANGGQIIVSDLARQLVRDGDHLDVEFLDLGEHLLADLPEALRLYRVVAPGLDDDRPLRVVHADSSRRAVPGPVMLARRSDIHGRVEELAAQRDAWRHVQVGARRILFVEGEPGIGKSRLAAEVAAEAVASGGVALWGRCDREAVVSFQPFVEALGGYLREAPSAVATYTLGVDGRLVAELLPGLEPMADPAEPGPSKPPSGVDRGQLFDAATAVLGRIADDRPMVFVVDDLQWASAATVLLLQHWLRRAVTSPVLFIGTFRPAEVAPPHPVSALLAEVAGDPSVVHLILGDLAVSDVEAMARELHLSDGSDLGDVTAAAQAVHQRTRGNPLLSTQLLRELSEGPDARRAALLEPGSSAVPGTLRHIVAQRLDRLPEGTADVLRIAAALGETFDLITIEAVTADRCRNGGDELDLIEAAATARLVEETALPGRFTFVHALVRDSFYGSQTEARRRRLHHEIADALAAGDADPPVVAHHYVLAAPEASVEALEWLGRAALHHRRNHSYEDEVHARRQQLDLLDEASELDPERRARIHHELASALGLAGDVDACKLEAEEVAAEARACGATDLMVQAVITRISHGRFGAGDMTGADLLRDALNQLDEDQPYLRSYVLSNLALHEAITDGNGTAADPIAREAVAMARRSGSETAVLDAVGIRLRILQGSHNVEVQQELLHEVRRLGNAIAQRPHEQSSAPPGEIVAEMYRSSTLAPHQGVVCIQAGDRSGFCNARVELEQSVEHLHDWLSLAIGKMWDGLLAALEGRWDDATSHSDDMLSNGRGELNFQMSWSSLQLTVARERGTLIDLEELVLEVARTVPHPSTLAWAMVMKLDSDRPELAAAGAVDLMDRGLDAAAQAVAGAFTLAALSEVWFRVDDVDRAREVEARLLPYRGQLLVVAWGVYVVGAADRYLAMLASRQGRWHDADALFASALALEESVGSSPLATRTRACWARSLLERPGADGDARTLLGRAAVDAAMLGMTRLIDEIEALAPDP